ncbi:unnamed protein product [Peniophora sp. CBMAI 1063]|nr:unnamed protein product [Peniophora sp. CBMAI 1063]
MTDTQTLAERPGGAHSVADYLSKPRQSLEQSSYTAALCSQYQPGLAYTMTGPPSQLQTFNLAVEMDTSHCYPPLSLTSDSFMPAQMSETFVHSPLHRTHASLPSTLSSEGALGSAFEVTTALLQRAMTRRTYTDAALHSPSVPSGRPDEEPAIAPAVTGFAAGTEPECDVAHSDAPGLAVCLPHTTPHDPGQRGVTPAPTPTSLNASSVEDAPEILPVNASATQCLMTLRDATTQPSYQLGTVDGVDTTIPKSDAQAALACMHPSFIYVYGTSNTLPAIPDRVSPKPPTPASFRCLRPSCNRSFKKRSSLKYHLEIGWCAGAPSGELRTTQVVLALRGLSDESELSKDEAREVKQEVQRRLRPFGCDVDDCPHRYRSMSGLRYHYRRSGQHGIEGLRLLASGQHECLRNRTGRALHATQTAATIALLASS